MWEPGVVGFIVQTTDHTVQVEQCSVALCILLRANDMVGPLGLLLLAISKGQHGQRL